MNWLNSDFVTLPLTLCSHSSFACELGVEVPHLALKGGRILSICSFPFSKVKLLSHLLFHVAFLFHFFATPFSKVGSPFPKASGFVAFPFPKVILIQTLLRLFAKVFAYVVLPFLKGLGRILWQSLQSLL